MNRIFERKFVISGLIILALFFCIAAAVCIHLFMKASDTAADAGTLSQAVTEASSISETLKSSDGDLVRAAELLRSHKSYDVTDNTLILYYDENFDPAYESSSRYTAVITKETYDDCYSYGLLIRNGKSSEKNDGKIYQLSFKALKGGAE